MFVTNTYASVTLGVSEQIPQDRLDGQHTEQVNLISDIKRGIARRHGSHYQGELVIQTNTSKEDRKLTHEDMRTFNTVSFFVGSEEYMVLMRRKKKVEGSFSDGIYIYHPTSKKFIDLDVASGDTNIDKLLDGGISSSVNIGRYMMLAGNDLPVTFDQNNRWVEGESPKHGALWVRLGSFVREYIATVVLKDGTSHTVKYKTPSSVYTGYLDLSDLNPQDVSYQHQVNIRQAQHDKATNDYMAAAAEAITTENIAKELASRINLAFGKNIATVKGDSYVYIYDENLLEITCSDSSDGDSLWGIGREVIAPERVCPQHWIGKVVRVKPERATEEQVYYLEATPKVPNTTGWGEVVWRESTGVQVVPKHIVSLLTVHEGKAYLATTPEYMHALTGLDTVSYQPNKVGDLLTTPLPHFFGRKIDYLGVDQDRLVVGSGATLMFSKSGDYFNFFRGSVLTVAENDPFELYALDSEDDTIVSSCIYDRNLILFGKRKQYVVNGRQILTPATASVIAFSAYDDAVDATPIVSGQHLYFASHRHNQTTLHQMQIGYVQDAPEARSVSLQLDRYIRGVPLEIKAVTSPNVVFVRTKGNDTGVYVYVYLDAEDGRTRIHEAWSRWEYAKELGNIVGISLHDGDPIIFTLRCGKDNSYLVADRFTYQSYISDYPYLDSMIPTDQPVPMWFSDKEDRSNVAVCYGAGDKNFIGTSWKQAHVLPEADYPAYIGVGYNSHVTLTSPYLRDRNDKAIVDGHLTIMSLSISLETTTALYGDVTAYGKTITTLKYEGRKLNQDTAELNVVPIPSRVVTMTIGRKNTDYQASLRSINWFPMTVASITWKGQEFRKR